MTHVDIEGLIDYLVQLLGKQFADEVATIYFGDPGIFPPQAFQDSKGKPTKAAIAILPNYDRYDTESGRSFAGEFRRYGVHVIVLINMVPYFEAMPKEAIGERQLVRLAGRIRQFLAHEMNATLAGRVGTTTVGDINWNWMMRDQTAIRAAAIEYEVGVYISRQPT